jgi:O-antigen/teichoic acid export membrane protein
MKYFKNTSWLFAEKILRMVVGLLVGVWVARYLGPEKFGLLSYALSFVALFSIIATFGLDEIVVRELVKDDSRRDDLIGTAFWLKLCGAFVVLLLLAFAVIFTSNDNNTNTLIFIIASALIFQSFNVIDFYFQSKVMGKFIVYANLISLFVSSIIKITLILNDASLIAFAWVVLFDGFILACGFIYFFLIHSTFKINNLIFYKSTAFDLLKDSWPLIFSGAVLMIQARIDQIMIKEMINSTEVGYYSAAIRLIEAFGFIPVMLKISLYPSILNSRKDSNELYQNRLLNFYRLNFLLFLAVAIPLFLFSEQIVNLLFGIEYQSVGILLSLMVIRLFFANMGVARSAYILNENLMVFSLITMTLGTITNIVLNYYWIPLYASKGAIIATIISFIVSIFVVDIFYAKTRNNVILQFKGIFSFYKLKV